MLESCRLVRLQYYVPAFKPTLSPIYRLLWSVLHYEVVLCDVFNCLFCLSDVVIMSQSIRNGGSGTSGFSAQGEFIAFVLPSYAWL